MHLYHASTMKIENPRIVNRFKTLDFGEGFYTTTNEDQAREFALKVHQRRKLRGTPTVNVFSFDENRALRDLDFLEFSAPEEAWLDFVVSNRKNGRDPNCKADIIKGPVANDDVFATIALYEMGQLNKDETLERFKVKSLFDQILFCNEKSLEYLKFIESYEVSEA